MASELYLACHLFFVNTVLLEQATPVHLCIV